MTSTILDTLSVRANTLQASKIREIAELGMRQDDVIPLWFGEGAWQTSSTIVNAAVTSLNDGNHKYQPNNGALNLRQQICDYSNQLLGCNLTHQRVTVTPSGMQGLMLSAQILSSPGDRVVAIEPGWPNIVGAFNAAGASVDSVSLTAFDGVWQLDMQALLDKLTPGTKAVVINSPNNPTGWVMNEAEQVQLLNHCRKHKIWIVADDVYSRLYRHGDAAPSFLTIARDDDLLISVNSFSKCWSMTGWRLGWIVAPAVLETKLGQLSEFNTSCTPGFVQDAGIAALQDSKADVSNYIAQIATSYQYTAEQLSSFQAIDFIQPDGAFYCFFKVAGLTDSFAAAKQIMQHTKVGLAPGIAFGDKGEGYLRLCYAQPLDVLEQAFQRLAPFLKR